MGFSICGAFQGMGYNSGMFARPVSQKGRQSDRLHAGFSVNGLGGRINAA